MIRSPSFSRDSESRTTMASPRAVKRWVSYRSLEREGQRRRTECLNGFWDGVEGGLGGAVWLLVGRHCRRLVVVRSSLEFRGLRSSGLSLQRTYRLDNDVVWYSIRARFPLAERFPMPTSPDVQCFQILFFSSSSSRIIKKYDGQRGYSKQCSSRTGYVQ